MSTGRVTLEHLFSLNLSMRILKIEGEHLTANIRQILFQKLKESL